MRAMNPGGHDSADLRLLLERACQAAGLDPRSAELLRGQTNAVFRLASVPVLIKVATYGTPVARVRGTVELVSWLMDIGYPTAPLHPVLQQQPLVVDGQAVTFWTYLPQPAHPVPAEALAGPLRALHGLRPSPKGGLGQFGLRRLDALTTIRKSLAETTKLPEEALHVLRSEADRIEGELENVKYELPTGLLHGDPQHGNALHTDNGVVLCDWDSAVFGPPEWDLVTVEVHCRRFGYGHAHYRRFADNYGWDVTCWDGYPVLRDLRELRMITTNARKATYTPETLPEVLRRVEALRRSDPDCGWRIL